MPRRSVRHRYAIRRSIKTTKYSNETFASMPPPADFDSDTTYMLPLVPKIEQGGVRKAKNFTLRIATDAPIPIFFALVYVPEGNSPSEIKFGTTISQHTLTSMSFYEPNQNVIIAGICGGGQQSPMAFKTRLARNLNSNDSVVLVFRPCLDIEQKSIAAMLNYAISY